MSSRHPALVIRSPVMLSPWLSTFIGAAFALPAKTIAMIIEVSKQQAETAALHVGPDLR
jgi:hypothetical protein